MGIQETENIERHEEAEAVGEMLADAFLTRVKRFPVSIRRGLLIACRKRLLQDNEIARLLLEGD